MIYYIGIKKDCKNQFEYYIQIVELEDEIKTTMLDDESQTNFISDIYNFNAKELFKIIGQILLMQFLKILNTYFVIKKLEIYQE